MVPYPETTALPDVSCSVLDLGYYMLTMYLPLHVANQTQQHLCFLSSLFYLQMPSPRRGPGEVLFFLPTLLCDLDMPEHVILVNDTSVTSVT